MIKGIGLKKDILAGSIYVVGIDLKSYPFGVLIKPTFLETAIDFRLVVKNIIP